MKKLINQYWCNWAIGLLIGVISMLSFVSPIVAVSVEDPLVSIQDLARMDGIRENQLSGYGLVIGLSGTGDTRFSPTFQMLTNLINSYGVVTDQMVKAKNVAAVIVTATLPPFARSGDRLDVNIASFGDAKSLQGGVLLSTALRAPNGQIYAVAQGPISIGGFQASNQGAGVQKNHLLVANLPNGGLIERTLEPDFSNLRELNFLLDKANPQTAILMVQAINDHFKYVTSNHTIAEAINSGRISVKIPELYLDNVIGFIAQINGLQVRASMPAKVIINERTGTIVMGHNVRISTVAVAHGNLTVVVSTQVESLEITDSQGNQLTETHTDSQVNVIEENNRLIEVRTGTTIGDVVKALNAIGATPRDIIAILQGMKKAGALYAEFEIM